MIPFIENVQRRKANLKRKKQVPGAGEGHWDMGFLLQAPQIF